MIGKVNVGGNDGSKINIFTQLTEPITKEGIWLQVNKSYKKIINDTKFYFANAWIDRALGLYNDLPYEFSGGEIAVAVGTDIYVFGMKSATYDYLNAVKYDTLTNTYVTLAKCPYRFDTGTAVLVGRSIYLVGGPSSPSYYMIYKYDIDTNTFTQVANISGWPMYHSTSVAVGTDIYIFGSYDSADDNTMGRFDTLTNTRTSLPVSPKNITDAQGVLIGNYIYIFGGTGGAQTAHKYEYSTGVWTQLATPIPSAFTKGASLAIGTDVYMFFGTNAYVYDTLTDTYTKLPDIPYVFTDGAVVNIGDKLYLIGGANSKLYLQVFSLISKQFDENTIVLFRSDERFGTYYAQLVTPKKLLEGALFTRLLTGFNSAYYFVNGDLTSPPLYYGDGVKWIKIR